MPGKYEINVGDARAAVSGARSNFDDLHGHEAKIKASSGELADASREPKIEAALQQVFDDFLKPWTATFVEHGDNILAAADSIISEFVAADGEMESAANLLRQADIQHRVETIDDTPDYGG